ncbi:MAG: hypothetical protein K8S62_00380 [Candidatus Sabulitectum sp.]|nr:hypothetical protein [Candidatus Sabulitectum sp.]
MINSIATILFCTIAAQSGDQTVLSTAERFFYRHDYQQASDMIDSHSWTDNSFWSQAGLIRELCDGGWSIECPPMIPGNFHPLTSSVSIIVSGEFSTGDSVRVMVPIPAGLPWQIPSDTPDIAVTGISGSAETAHGWLLLEGRASGAFEIAVSQQVSIDPPPFAGVDVPGSADAMVPFPGEDTYLDTCLNTDAFWSGEDAVYMESVRLAAGEPNPMRLVRRVIDAVSDYYTGSIPVNEQVLLYPSSMMALQGELFNSMGGASLGAAVLRRWQIPALVVPGRWGTTGSPGFLLAAYVKPFGWMIVSPCPRGFTALGSFESPLLYSWFNGIGGITFQAEYLGSDGFWHAVPVDSPEFAHTVEILTQ